MMRATMDLIALYKYDSSILDNLVYPDALDGDVLKDNLLMESAEMELLYTDFDFLKLAIGSWSAKQLPIWQHLLDTTKYDYNPIWNKDGTVTETETRDLKGSEKVKDETDRVDNLTDKNTRDFEDKETRDLKNDSLNSVYGFNSLDAAPANKDEAKDTGTDTIEHSGTDTMDHTGRQDIDRNLERDTTDTGTVKHERIEQGNIGLTSTQDLISQERQIALFNVMDVIIKDFIKRFCLAVY